MKNVLLFIWYLLKPVLVIVTSPVWFPAAIVLCLSLHLFLGVVYWVQSASLSVQERQAKGDKDKLRELHYKRCDLQKMIEF